MWNNAAKGSTTATAWVALLYPGNNRTRLCHAVQCTGRASLPAGVRLMLNKGLRIGHGARCTIFWREPPPGAPLGCAGQPTFSKMA